MIMRGSYEFLLEMSDKRPGFWKVGSSQLHVTDQIDSIAASARNRVEAVSRETSNLNSVFHMDVDVVVHTKGYRR
jgi:hypothetical protein